MVERRWTPKEDEIFRRMAEANIRPELIAAKLNRSIHAIKARAYTIGLPLKWFKPKVDTPRRSGAGARFGLRGLAKCRTALDNYSESEK